LRRSPLSIGDGPSHGKPAKDEHNSRGVISFSIAIVR
jgi:hypothetical protein